MLMILWLRLKESLHYEMFKDGMIWCLGIVSKLPEIGGKVGKVTDEIRYTQLDSWLSWVMVHEVSYTILCFFSFWNFSC